LQSPIDDIVNVTARLSWLALSVAEVFGFFSLDMKYFDHDREVAEPNITVATSDHDRRDGYVKSDKIFSISIEMKKGHFCWGCSTSVVEGVGGQFISVRESLTS
jgi:hypothetical protein